jgi:hypothetical protein
MPVATIFKNLEAGRGRPTTFWAAIDCEYTEPTQEVANEVKESAEELT